MALVKTNVLPQATSRSRGVALVAATLTAYTVSLTATTMLLPVALQDDWGKLEQGALGKVRWVSGEGATAMIVNPTGQARPVQLRLRLQAFAKERTLRLRLNEQIVTTQPIKAALQTVTVPLTLPAGVSTLKLDSLEPPITPRSLDPTSSDERPLTYAVLELALELKALSRFGRGLTEGNNYIRSNTAAIPCPPPIHRAATP